MKVTEKYSDSNKVVEREGSKIIAEYFNAMEEKEQIFFFELFFRNSQRVRVRSGIHKR